jgi:serine/threonine-protein kinase SRPK3
MFPESMIPYWIMRKFTMELLAALEFAHDHNVIHTGALSLTVLAVVMLNILTDKRADIKPDNIFVKFRDTSLIESGYLVNVPIPQQDRAEERYSTVPATPLCGYYFDEEEPRQILELDIALGDWGVSSWATQHLTERIQPVALRAPEVLIQAPWDGTTDWWNLGAVVFELYCAVRMFDGRVGPDGHYEPGEHAAEIVDLFGPFPKELLVKGNQDLVQKIFYEDGKLKEFPSMGRPPLASEAFMPGLKQEDIDLFASFLKDMMRINPKERLSAAELLEHPWLRTKK